MNTKSYTIHFDTVFFTDINEHGNCGERVPKYIGKTIHAEVSCPASLVMTMIDYLGHSQFEIKKAYNGKNLHVIWFMQGNKLMEYKNDYRNCTMCQIVLTVTTSRAASEEELSSLIEQ